LWFHRTHLTWLISAKAHLICCLILFFLNCWILNYFINC
jgi:hypothetical protein